VSRTPPCSRCMPAGPHAIGIQLGRSAPRRARALRHSKRIRPELHSRIRAAAIQRSRRTRRGRRKRKEAATDSCSPHFDERLPRRRTGGRAPVPSAPPAPVDGNRDGVLRHLARPPSAMVRSRRAIPRCSRSCLARTKLIVVCCGFEPQDIEHVKTAVAGPAGKSFCPSELAAVRPLLGLARNGECRCGGSGLYTTRILGASVGLTSSVEGPIAAVAAGAPRKTAAAGRDARSEVPYCDDRGPARPCSKSWRLRASHENTRGLFFFFLHPTANMRRTRTGLIRASPFLSPHSPNSGGSSHEQPIGGVENRSGIVDGRGINRRQFPRTNFSRSKC